MRGKNELIALAIMIIMCLMFAACAQKVEDKLTDKATDPSLISSAAASESADETEKSTPVDAADAELALQKFYGSLYTVKKTASAGGVMNYTVKDKNGKEYATVTVELATGTVTETVTGTKEVNQLDLDF